MVLLATAGRNTERCGSVSFRGAGRIIVIGSSQIKNQITNLIMTEVIGLTADSLLEKEKNDRIVMELELKKRAFEAIVPTLPAEVQEALRYYNQPIRIFGEDASDTSQKLRVVLAYRSLLHSSNLRRRKSCGMMRVSKQSRLRQQLLLLLPVLPQHILTLLSH